LTVLSGAAVTLGAITFDPPPQAITTKKDAYVVEHQVPGMEGGVVEYVGSRQQRFQLHGLLVESGADLNMLAMMGMKGTSQLFSVASTQSGQYFASGPVFVEDVKFDYGAGHGYPYYGFVIDLVAGASGAGGVASLALQSNVSVGLGFSFGVPSFGHLSHVQKSYAGVNVAVPSFGPELHAPTVSVGVMASG
jgi:hypothetical protein